MSEFVRARRPEHKQQRRDAILTAARQLAVDVGVAHVSLGDVARAVGLAKSNVVRYFGTREEIYLELTAGCFREWRDEVLERLDAGEDAVDALTETLNARPLFCDLLSHSPTSLEHNVSVNAAGDYKRVMVATIADLGAAVSKARPGLDDGEGMELVAAAVALTGAVYPAANPAPTLVEAFEQNPDLSGARLRFLPTMKRLLGAVAAGLPALRS